MSCGGSQKEGVAACVCTGPTVFDGAVIGQVFTGDVQMRCPHAEQIRQSLGHEIRHRGSETPLSAALLVVAILESSTAIPGMTPWEGGSLIQAAFFLALGVGARKVGSAIENMKRRLRQRVRGTKGSVK